MKVLALTRYAGLGVTSRIRFHQYLPYLREAGIEVSTAHFLDDRYVERLHEGGRNTLWLVVEAYLRRLKQLTAVRKYDLLWIEKELLPWLPAFPERLLRSAGIPYVVDYDDATFHGYDMHRQAVVRRLLGRKIDEVMRNASAVVAGNDYLAERARSAGAAAVEYVPTVVDLNRYPIADAPPADRPFTIGWIGSGWTSRYLAMVEDALLQVCGGGRACVLLIGSGAVEMKGVEAEVQPWSEAEEYALIQRCDAGIMPLPDNPFERGKCGYKLIQYMACSLPVAASAVGVNSKIVEHGVNGFLASSSEDWIHALTELRDRPELRRSMGRSGRVKIEREYSLQVQAPRLAEILKRAALRA